MNDEKYQDIVKSVFNWYHDEPARVTGTITVDGMEEVTKRAIKDPVILSKINAIAGTDPVTSEVSLLDMRQKMIWEFFKAAETGLKANPSAPEMDLQLQLAEAILKTDYFLEQLKP